MDEEPGENVLVVHSKKKVIKAVIIVVLFLGSLFLLWRERMNRPVQIETNLVEESRLVVKTINESTAYTNIDAQIPQFTNATTVFNKKIESYVRDRIDEHKRETEENWKARVETSDPSENLPIAPEADNKMYFYAKFDAPEQNNNDYISILTRLGGYTGGAHGYEEVVSYNFDIKNKKEISLADLFINEPDYLVKISNISRQVLIDRFVESLGVDFGDDKKEREAYIKESLEPMVYAGTDPSKPENFANFTFNKNKLIIHFGQYQVAPYVMGLQDVEINLPL